MTENNLCLTFKSDSQGRSFYLPPFWYAGILRRVLIVKTMPLFRSEVVYQRGTFIYE